MIPILAASSVIGSIDKIAHAAASEWKQVTSASSVNGKSDVASGASSFGAVLAAVANGK